MENLFSWIETKLNDDNIFPTSVDKPFPKNFKQEIQVILKRLFRVFAHIYFVHFEKIQELQAEGHLNVSFKYFVLFVTEFNLVDKKEMAPLASLIEKFNLN